jgi:hypothetical protein
VSGRTLVTAVATLRGLLGVGGLLAPRRTARLFGFPPEQVTPTAVLFGRWFAIRELVLATLAVTGHGGPALVRREAPQRDFARLNALNDALDAAAMLAPVVRRQGLDRPQFIGVPVALAITAAWRRVLREEG